MASNPSDTILALDVGQRRIGLATATLAAKLPSPHSTIDNNTTALQVLEDIINQHNVTQVVVGLPRGLNGQETDQTRAVRQFVKTLRINIKQPIYLQDEALTSVKAQQELHDRKVQYNKGTVDALAATYILSDFLTEHSGSI